MTNKSDHDWLAVSQKSGNSKDLGGAEGERAIGEGGGEVMVWAENGDRYPKTFNLK